MPNARLGDSCMKKWEKFSRDEIERFVKESKSYSQLSRKLGYGESASGSANKTIRSMIEELSLDVSHFMGQGWNKGSSYESNNYMPFNEYINGEHVQTNKVRKKLLREGIKKHICECCLNTMWNGQPIPLEVHHKDGNKTNNSLNNLQLLCPNCHALTDTYRGKNTKKHKQLQ